MEENDFVKELGFLSFPMRLKRISDAMLHQGKRLYKELDEDIEPNWFLIFKILKKHKAMTVTEIASKVRLSHPSVISITNKMMKSGYLESSKDKIDFRKRQLVLSEKARRRLPELETIWEAGGLAVNKALKGLNAMEFISILEDKFYSKGFNERTIAEMKPLHKFNEEKELRIVEFEEEYTKYFTNLNFEWLKKYFYIEDYDREVLTQPQKYIIDKGGIILFAIIGEIVVGTVALIKRGDGIFELSKMAVTEAYQARKIGQKLMLACIDIAREKAWDRLFLDSNRKLKPAINLYHKIGFIEIPVPDDSPYERCNIRMELKLI
jgi:DNA-binding MarR family transcriptional regulator/N-acetylglutamate synthase-like GNAT family acetyltransferase